MVGVIIVSVLVVTLFVAGIDLSAYFMSEETERLLYFGDDEVASEEVGVTSGDDEPVQGSVEKESGSASVSEVPVEELFEEDFVKDINSDELAQSLVDEIYSMAKEEQG